MVANPKHGSEGNIFQYIRDRAKYGEKNYPEKSWRIGSIREDLMISTEAKWHGLWDSETIHSSMLKRAKQKYENNISNKWQITSPSASCTSQNMFRHSQSKPLNKDMCFVCVKGPQYENPLHKVTTTGVGESLPRAVEKSNDDTLKVKLGTAIGPTDAHL